MLGHDTMFEDTTELSYWFNWRFFCCAAVVVAFLIVAVILVWKYEGTRRAEYSDVAERLNERSVVLYQCETWMTCLKEIQPGWLLGFRILAFLVLLSLLTANLVLDGGGIMYYYTQWTFTLVTIYFALGCVMSIHGLSTSFGRLSNAGHVDTERGNYVVVDEDIVGTSTSSKTADLYWEAPFPEIAGLFGYIFQIVFQVSCGAVVITDAVYWLILFPFLRTEDCNTDFINTCMHSVNALFMLGDTFLNCLRFPVFRCAYLFIWSAVYVIFQWIIHACLSLWWPYPFLNLSFPYAPLCYLGMGVIHIPCYGFFALIVKLKHFWLSKYFPESCQGF